MPLSFDKKLFFIFLLLLVAVLMIFIVTLYDRKSYDDSSFWVNHTEKVLYKSEKVISLLKDIETGTRGYVITGDTVFLDAYYASRDSIIHNITELKELIKDNPEQLPRLSLLASMAERRIRICNEVIQIRRQEGMISGNELAMIKKGKMLMDSIRHTVNQIQLHENRLLKTRESTNATNAANFNKKFFFLFGCIFLLFIFTFFSIRYGIIVRKQEGKKLFQLNNKLVSANKKVESLINGISDPFFALDKDGKFTYINAAAQHKMGFDKTDPRGKNIFEEFKWYNENLIGKKLKQALQNPVESSFEYFDDFFEKWQDVTIYPMTDGITVYINDASERKKNEKELIRTRQLMQETNDVAHIGGWEMDLEKNTLEWTPVTKLIHEVPGDYVPDLKKGINFYKEGESRDLIIEKVDQAIESGKEWDVELQLTTALGNVKWIRTKGKAEMVNGSCIRLFGTFQDIDDQKKMLNQLKESEASFRGAFEHSAIGMAMVAPDGTFIRVNDKLSDITGYSKAALMELSFAQITHPLDIETSAALMKEFNTSARLTYEGEKRYIHKDGRIIWSILAVSAVKDSNDQLLYYISKITDISRSKAIEKAISEERVLLKTLINNIPVNIYIKDLQSRKTLVNRSEMEYLGVTDERILLGKNDYDLYPSESAEISMQEDQEIFRTGQPMIDKETMNTRHDGTKSWFLTSKIPLRNDEGEITGLLGISYDITARKGTI